MLSPGILIAIDVTLLYLIMAPLVLYALYVVFDSLGRRKNGNLKPTGNIAGKDPALWSDEDILL
ncbi:MAG: hypothetical protein JW786_14170 [Desulfobacterales bacterium]|nr:hypothetical protein [Desulfobacterales bacterium]